MTEKAAGKDNKHSSSTLLVNMTPTTESLSELQKQVFTHISNHESSELRTLLASNKMKIDFVDENGMSPLQHACYKGNKEIVQMLLDQVG